MHVNVVTDERTWESFAIGVRYRNQRGETVMTFTSSLILKMAAPAS